MTQGGVGPPRGAPGRRVARTPEPKGVTYPADGSQTWTFSRPVQVTFTVAGLNCAGENMRLPVGSRPVSLGTGHSYDEATGLLSGGAMADPGTGSTFVAPGLRTELVLTPLGAPTCGRGPTAMSLHLPEPFDCSASTVFIAQGSPSQLQRLVASSGSSEFEPVGAPVLTYNSIAYNPADGLIYGATFEGDIVAVDRTGSVLVLGRTDPTVGWSNVGVIGPDGKYYVGTSGGFALYVVDLEAWTATVLPLDDQLGTSDLALIDGMLWGDGGPSGGLTRVDPTTGHVSRFPSPVPDTVSAGAAWTYANGNLGLSDNTSGDVYQIAIADGAGDAPSFEIVAVHPGPSSTLNDGTSCEGLPADLSLTKTGTTPVVPGHEITWTITVTNEGPGTSSGFVVTDTLPAEVTDVATSTPGCTVDGNKLTCHGGVLEPGGQHEIVVTGRAPAVLGPLPNTATVTGNEDDPDPEDNASTWVTTVAAAAGRCRGTSVGLLGIRLGSANNPETPCRTQVDQLATVNQVIGNALPWPLSALNSTLKATAVGGSTVSGPTFAGAEAHVATAAINIPSLGLSLAVTGVQTTASAALGDSCGERTLNGTSVIGGLVLNGGVLVIGDQPVSIPLPGLGGLYLNQRVVEGNTIIQRAVFLDLPGTALDVAIAESKAGVGC